MGHIRMMSSVQPFLSGAISKTVNMPTSATTEDIETAYLEAWKLGLKAIAVYRDGCKRSQPLNAGKAADAKAEEAPSAEALANLQRRRLPDERSAITHKFSIGGHEGYMTVGMYADGTPGELFVTMAKEGSVVSGLMDSFATSISMALQYGVPLKVLVDKFSHRQIDHRLHLPLAVSQVPPLRGRPHCGEGDDAGRGARGASAQGRAANGGGLDGLLRAGHRLAGAGGLALPRPGRRPALPELRQHHGAQRRLLQVPQLRNHDGVFLTARPSGRASATRKNRLDNRPDEHEEARRAPGVIPAPFSLQPFFSSRLPPRPTKGIAAPSGAAVTPR
jgi:hypothetical protein